MLITIRNRWLLRLFWGKRELYPAYVTAHWRLWLSWLHRRPGAFFERVDVRKHGSKGSKTVKLGARKQLQEGF